MSQQHLLLGTVANDGTGDTLRAAGDKIEANFAELYGSLFDPSAPGPIGGTAAAAGAFTTLSFPASGGTYPTISAPASQELRISTVAGDIKICRAGEGDANFPMPIGGAGWGNTLRIGDFSAGAWGSKGSYLVPDAANTLALRNGANAQTFHLYDTYTDASNYRRGSINETSGYFQIVAESAGTGGANNLVLRSSPGAGTFYDAADHYFRTQAGVEEWGIHGAHFLAATDNTYDIGASGANRPRNGFFGNAVVSPYFAVGGTSGVSLQTGANGVLLLQDIFNANDFARLQFGGTTASFPALKRSGSDLEIVKADGTAADTAVILASPDGTRYRLTISNAGAVTVTAA